MLSVVLALGGLTLATLSAPEVLERSACPETPPGDDFAELFRYGEACGASLPVHAAVARGAALPDAQRRTYLDGLSHGLDVPADLRAWMDAVDAAPAEARPYLHEGAIRAWTEQVGGEPDRVLPWVADYSRLFADASEDDTISTVRPFNGVRVGLQRVAGPDLARALHLAGRYPEDWWPPLYEELGWRAGDRLLVGGPDPEPLLSEVPAAGRCAFVQGVARGIALQQLKRSRPDLSEVGAWVRRANSGCEQAGWTGLAWAALISHHDDAAAAVAALDLLDEEEGRQAARQAVEALGSHDARLAPWTPLR